MKKDNIYNQSIREKKTWWQKQIPIELNPVFSASYTLFGLCLEFERKKLLILLVHVASAILSVAC